MPASAIRPVHRERARAPCGGPTEAERRLPRALRLLNGRRAAHFRRQAPVGPSIVDFADLSGQLVIEVDGGQHGGPADQARDAWLSREGFLVLRFWNHDVLANLEGVAEVVPRTLKERPRPHPTPPPQGGREAPAAPTGRERDVPNDEPADRPGASLPPRGEGMEVGLGRPRQNDRRGFAPTRPTSGGGDAED